MNEENPSIIASMKLSFGSLFAGIGGFDLGFERAGMECKWQVEIDAACQRILAKHWPSVNRINDITTWEPTITEHYVDCICAGFPCQDISIAGRNDGIDGKRTGLWREVIRISRILRPRVIVLENVPVIVNRGWGRVCGALAELGYSTEWEIIPAAMFGAPVKRRSRFFAVAFADGQRLKKGRVFDQDSLQCAAQKARKENWDGILVGGDSTRFRRIPDPRICRVANGVSYGVDRLRGLGNAVVPQVAEWIGKRVVSILGDF